MLNNDFYCSIHYLFPTADRPSYNELLHLDGSDLKIIKWITSLEKWQCTDFAHMLLKDGLLVNKYKKNYKEKDEFVREVLNDWLSRNDDDPSDSATLRTWAALAKCITDADLPGALTKAINDACPPPAGMFRVYTNSVIQLLSDCQYV